MLALEVIEATHELVIIGVADLGLVENVIQMLVASDLGAKPLDFVKGCGSRLDH
jgi:hypothetical protein